MSSATMLLLAGDITGAEATNRPVTADALSPGPEVPSCFSGSGRHAPMQNATQPQQRRWVRPRSDAVSESAPF
jgi:hypothetical protein